MAAVTRKTDVCTGHGCYPPRKPSKWSPDVYTNDLQQLRQTDTYVGHGCDVCVPHGGSISSGSGTVYVNNKQMARTGDPVDCGSSCGDHSDDVFCGD